MRINFSRVRKALKDLENHASYYVGGSLCIDFKDMPSVVLNRDGRGFSYNAKGDGGRFKFLLTLEMQKLVELAYKKYKAVSV